MMKMIAIVMLALVGAGCGKKTSDDPGKAAAPGMSDERTAFALGRKVGFIEVYVVMKKPDLVGEALEKAQTLAQGLGITPPKMPGPDDHLNRTIHDELIAKKTQKVADTFALGYEITHAWFGAMLGSDVGTQVQEIEMWAKKSGVPESVWRAPYDKLEAKPTADDLDALAKDLEAYFKS